MAKEQNFAHPPRGHVAILAYDDVNNRWQVVECTADGYLKTRLQEVNGTVLVQQYMPSLLQPGINTYIGTDWQKQPMIWGFTERWSESLDISCDASGYVLKRTTAVDTGYVHVVEAVACQLTERETTSVSIECRSNPINVPLNAVATLAANTYLFWAGRATLQVGDQIQIYMAGTNENDHFVGRVWGYKMKVDM